MECYQHLDRLSWTVNFIAGTKKHNRLHYKPIYGYSYLLVEIAFYIFYVFFEG